MISFTHLFILTVSTCLILSGCGGGSDSKITDIQDNSLSENTIIATSSLEKGHDDCINGGTSIETGFDTNEDGTLNPEEVLQTKIICSGNQGLVNLIRFYDEPVGENCESGGKKIITGIDSDKDTKLSEDEVTEIQYLCDTDIPSLINSIPVSLVAIVEEPAGENCSAGGKQIQTGLDNNYNGTLEKEEATDSSYLCNGEQGVAGTTTRSLQSISCNGPLENMDDLRWSYKIHQLTSGDAVVTASIFEPNTTVGSLAFYSGQELTNGVKPAVLFIHDVVPPNNYGEWTIFLNEALGYTFVIYHDIDLPVGTIPNLPNSIVWSMETDNCTTTLFE